MDSHDGYKMVRLFILLNTVTEDDGPLYYLEREETKKNWRWNWNVIRFPNQKTLRSRVKKIRTLRKKFLVFF